MEPRCTDRVAGQAIAQLDEQSRNVGDTWPDFQEDDDTLHSAGGHAVSIASCRTGADSAGLPAPACDALRTYSSRNIRAKLGRFSAKVGWMCIAWSRECTVAPLWIASISTCTSSAAS